ncbi:ABC transporter substrate-binding protein [Anaerovorax odorimutans]|uniref:ABC transporter substrate-binding protein n=1 Tax=Anaerovorax odorimutans TaxID=109327 RepID=UPI000414D9DF|nr:ABC transporter substrate-binding protein [Anaerovorax odorimutans]
MKKLLICILVLTIMVLPACSTNNSNDDAKTTSSDDSTYVITDMAGREVEVPSNIDSVLSRCPIGTIIMYTLNPEKIAGLNWEPTEVEKEYLSKEYLELPMLSGWYANGKTGNVEEILKVSPDIIFSSGTSAQASIDQADEIQNKLNIPVVIIDTNLDKLEEMYTFVGKLVGEEKRAEKLSKYTKELLADVDKKAKSIKDDEKVKVYYAEGPEGLLTDPSGSEHAEVIDLVGGINVAEVEIKSGMGRSEVSPEQLVVWKPDVIITCHDQGFGGETNTYNNVLKDNRFKSLDAIKNEKVYEVPYKPFNFTDRPPSVNRLIGILWLGNILYPDVYDYNIEDKMEEFYKLFYNVDLTDEQVDDILSTSRLN